MHKLLIISLSLVCISLVCVGCSKAPSDLNINYHSRLQSQLSLAELNHYSDSHNLTNTITPSTDQATISLLQLAEIQHCKLSSHIAEHNSQLGKLAVISKEFAYQINFIKEAKNCLPSIDNPSLKRALALALNNKIQSLDNYWQQLVFNDAQLRSLYLATPYSLYNVSENDKQNTYLALSYLQNIKLALQSQQYNQIDIEQLEFYLSKLHRNKYLPSLLRALKEQISVTAEQTNMLKIIDIDTLCKPGYHSNTSTILATIFTKFYGQQIQQYHNVLLKEYQFIKPSLLSLWSNLADKPYNESLMTLDSKLKYTSVEHVSWWQGLYKACKITPGT